MLLYLPKPQATANRKPVGAELHTVALPCIALILIKLYNAKSFSAKTLSPSWLCKAEQISSKQHHANQNTHDLYSTGCDQDGSKAKIGLARPILNTWRRSSPTISETLMAFPLVVAPITFLAEKMKAKLFISILFPAIDVAKRLLSS